METRPLNLKVPDTRLSGTVVNIATAVAVCAGLYVSSLYSYLLFHSLIELITIAIAFTLLLLTWNTRQYIEEGCLRILGLGYAFIAGIDLIHTLAYKGMGVLQGYDANLPTQLWIAARYLQAATLLLAPLYAKRGLKGDVIIGVYAVTVTGLLVAVFSGYFPDCYIEGRGLTPFKIVSEYVISALLCVALYLFYRVRNQFNRQIVIFLGLSIVATILSELAFTTYVSVYGFANLLGHYFKLAAFYLIYRAVVVAGLQRPLDFFFLGLKLTEEEIRRSRDVLEQKVRERTSELLTTQERYRRLIQKVPAAIVVHDGEGRVQTSNALAQELLGVSAEDLAGKPPGETGLDLVMEDGTDLPEAKYPVNLVLSARLPLRDYLVGLRHAGKEHITWCLVNAEPEFGSRGEIASVIVTFIDITARRRAEQERARLASFPMMNPNPVTEIDLAGRVTFVNPSARNLFPELERDSVAHPWLADWSRVASAFREGGRLRDQREVCVSGRWYQQTMTFLAAQRRLRIYGLDITERKLAEEATRRLNRELRALSDCSQAVMRADNEQSLLDEICRIICDKAGYRLAWVAYREDDEAKSIRPVAVAGHNAGYLEQLDLTWADTERGRGPVGTAARTGRSASVDDFLNDPALAPWRDAAVERGYRACAAMPLKDDAGNTFGVLAIYSTTPNTFSHAEMRLLEELADGLAFGITVVRARAAHTEH